jgi:hypothetical protein
MLEWHVQRVFPASGQPPERDRAEARSRPGLPGAVSAAIDLRHYVSPPRCTLLPGLLLSPRAPVWHQVLTIGREVTPHVAVVAASPTTWPLNADDSVSPCLRRLEIRPARSCLPPSASDRQEVRPSRHPSSPLDRSQMPPDFARVRARTHADRQARAIPCLFEVRRCKNDKPRFARLGSLPLARPKRHARALGRASNFKSNFAGTSPRLCRLDFAGQRTAVREQEKLRRMRRPAGPGNPRIP